MLTPVVVVRIKSRVAESEVKYPNFPKCPTPDSDLSKISDSLHQREWNLAVKINGNRSAQQEISFNKSFKETAPFQQEFTI